MEFLHDVTVVVRSVGERTEAACCHLLAQQFPKDNIFRVVNEAPHAAAFMKCLQVGMEQQRPWTLIVDADVLPLPSALAQLHALAVRAHPKILTVQGYVLCKYFGSIRPSGHNLFRTALLPKAIECVPDRPGLLPESETVANMATLGHPQIEVPEIVIGLHDYEQYYRDICCKSFLQIRRHGKYAMKVFEPLWGHGQANDADYKMALQVLHSEIELDSRQMLDYRSRPDDIIDKLMRNADLQEKEPLPSDAYSAAQIATIMDAFKPPPGVAAYRGLISYFSLLGPLRYTRWFCLFLHVIRRTAVFLGLKKLR